MAESKIVDPFTREDVTLTEWVSNNYAPYLFRMGHIYCLKGTFQPKVAITANSTIISKNWPAGAAFQLFDNSGNVYSMYTNSSGHLFSRRNIAANTVFYIGTLFTP